MRSFAIIVLIFIASLCYGEVFVGDPQARKYELERLQALAITPPPQGGEATLEEDELNDHPVLTSKPAQVFEKVPYRREVTPAPSPAPSRNEFRIDDTRLRQPAPSSLFAQLFGLIVTPAHAEAAKEGVSVKREDEVEIEFTTGDGRAWSAYVQRHDASVFLQSTLRYIDEERERTKEQFSGDLDRVFRDAFADRDASVEAFADWYYGFFTSSMLAGKGVWGGLQEITSLELDQIMSGVEVAVQQSIRYQYLTYVMKPELRDPIIQDGVRKAIMDAHRRYQSMIEGLDGRLITFISDKARYVRPLNTSNKVHLTLDWDSESWRAPLHYDRQAVFAGAGGVVATAIGVLASDVVLETVMSVLGAIVGEAVVSASAGAGGAAVGSELFPGVGTALGAAVGLGVHGAVNYFRDSMGREQFTADTNAAINATLETWHNMVEPTANTLIDRWFNETKRLVQTPEIEAKIGS
ncbi:hypothetical protein ATO13_23536 [Stappia sp. 22II-S9-Z10]|nr:hypothetical protein ATO13_23536 [Stappia sp. 22II-S9-Z10]